MAAVIKLSFDAIGPTRDDVDEHLDRLVANILTNEGGEPWIVIVDKIEKQIVDQQALISNDPSGWIYYGTRTVIFTGPTVHGQSERFHDGFRPQQAGELD